MNDKMKKKHLCKPFRPLNLLYQNNVFIDGIVYMFGEGEDKREHHLYLCTDMKG